MGLLPYRRAHCTTKADLPASGRPCSAWCSPSGSWPQPSARAAAIGIFLRAPAASASPLAGDRGLGRPALSWRGCRQERLARPGYGEAPVVTLTSFVQPEAYRFVARTR